MEEMIKKCFCGNCINKKENCMKIKVQNDFNLLTYKCINYAKKECITVKQGFEYIIKSDVL